MPDWFPKILPHLLTGVVLVVVLQSMARKKATPSQDGYGQVLRYSRWVGALGILLILMFLSISGLAIYQKREGWEGLAIGSAAFSLLGIFLFLYGTFTRVDMNGSKLTSHAFWREPVTIHWIEMAKVDFTSTKQFRFQSLGGARIQVDMLIGGLDLLLREMSKNLPPEKYLQAVRAYWKAAKAYQGSVGSVMAIPPSDLVNIRGHLPAPQLEKLLSHLSALLDEGLEKKELQDVLRQVKGLQRSGGIHFDLTVLFQGMPAHFFMFYYLTSGGDLGLSFYATPKMAERVQGEMEKAGASEVQIVVDEEDEE